MGIDELEGAVMRRPALTEISSDDDVHHDDVHRR